MKVFQKGITGSIWKTIDNWNASSSSSVLWNYSVSKPFTISQGVRQGGILSPLVYCLYVDEFLDILTVAQCGISIIGIYPGFLFVASHPCLCLSSIEDLVMHRKLSFIIFLPWSTLMIVAFQSKCSMPNAPPLTNCCCTN